MRPARSLALAATVLLTVGGCRGGASGPKVTLRYHSRLHHIGIGRAHKHRPIKLLIADRDIRIIDAQNGELIRELTLDPTRNYQPLQQT